MKVINDSLGTRTISSEWIQKEAGPAFPPVMERCTPLSSLGKGGKKWGPVFQTGNLYLGGKQAGARKKKHEQNCVRQRG